jgi:hypothetical protein
MMPPSCLSATQNKTERTWRDPEMRGGEQRDGNSIAAATQGLDAKKNQPSLPKGEVFLLDIPFYRTRLFSLLPTRSNECHIGATLGCRPSSPK